MAPLASPGGPLSARHARAGPLASGSFARRHSCSLEPRALSELGITSKLHVLRIKHALEKAEELAAPVPVPMAAVGAAAQVG